MNLRNGEGLITNCCWIASTDPKETDYQRGYDHIWENRTMTWLPKVLQPFISPAQLQMEIDGVQSLDNFLKKEKSTVPIKEILT